MKTVAFFLFTTFISVGCLETALGSRHPLLLYVIGFGVWILFVRYCNRVIKRRAERRQMEQQFQNFMRQQDRNFRR